MLRTLSCFVALSLAAVLSSCGQDSTPLPKQASADVQSRVAQIDARREVIEDMRLQRHELSASDLRAKVAQKWSKLHVYTDDDTVLRIKSYPHEGISERTEEFYFTQGQLILAVIEDEGIDPNGNEDEDVDKMYYFDSEQVIFERRDDDEAEYGNLETDGMELLQEAREYLELFKSQRSQPEP